MAHIAQTPTGIEVYTRQSDLQDQYPTAIRQDEYPTAYDGSQPYHAATTKEAEPTGEHGGSLGKSAGELKAKESRICGVNGLIFWLGLALGVLIVVVGVLGGVLDSRIRKGAESRRCVPQLLRFIVAKKKRERGRYFFLAAH